MTNASPGATPPPKKMNRKRKRMLVWLSSAFLAVGFIWLIYWLVCGQFHEFTDDAYVGGNMVSLMSQVSGTVVSIHTDDTRLVLQGEVLVTLDKTDYEIALQRARANLANTVRQVRQYFEAAEEAEQTVILRNAELMEAQADYKRRVGLIGERAVSREELLRYKTAAEGALARYNTALHNLRGTLAVVENSQLYTHPLVERAKANFKQAFLDLKRTTIYAPVTGYVAKRSVQVGQQIMKNTNMLAIIPLNQVWVDANYKESQLGRLRLNQPVILYADAYSGVTYHGKILGLSPGTGPVFALLPPQNATGNWIKIVQRLPVRISLDPKEIKEHPLQLGLSMRVTTTTYDTKGLRLAQVANRKALYETTIFTNELGKVNEEINDILKNNAPNMYLPWSQFSIRQGQA